MIANAAVRLLRIVGGAAFLASVGVIVGTVILQAAFGPVADQSIWPTPRLWRYFGTTLAMASGTTIIALILAIPAVVAFAQVRTFRQRRILASLILLPLVTMPSIFAYAWLLLATRPGSPVTVFLHALGWNAPAAPPFQSAWVLATWLWPIPAMVLIAAFNHGGRAAYHLALTDASGLRAFLCGALPVMRAPLVAALAITFILSATDATIAPLMGATEVWPVEMLATASIAAKYDRPAGYLFWASWPMLAMIALVACAAGPGLRQMARWADAPDDEITAPAGRRRAGVWVITCLIAAGIVVLPIVVFCTELSTGRASAAQSLATAYQTFRRDGLATLSAAALAAAAAVAMAVTLIDDAQFGRLRRIAGTIATALVVGMAVLPPELIGTALASFYSRLGDPARWNVYDQTPCVWAASLVARFGFLPVCIARLMNRRTREDQIAQARSDGASTLDIIAHIRLPALAGSLAVAGLLTACLSFSEIGATILVQPPQYFGGSLAVQVDSQMHYGRQDETIASSLMLMIPAIIVALLFPLRWRVRRAALVLICAIGLVGCDSQPRSEGRVDSVFGGPGLSPGEFSYPRALAVSPVDGCVYVVDKTARIQRFSATGEYQHQWRMPEWTNGKPTGLFVDRTDQLWVADTHYARVMAFDRDGKEMLRFGRHGEGPGEFTFPCSVAVGPDDLVYVGEYGGNDRVNKFTREGTFVGAFADKASGPAWVERPVGLVFDESGDLWVADACHHRICRFGRDGKLLSTFGQPGSEAGQLNYPYGLALEAGGTILVADRGNNRIVRFDRAGKYLGHWGGPGRAVGQLAQPWGVAVSAKGLIYALDSWNNRIQVVEW
ncbi:MAG TPA: hypothetical protein VJZ71_13620 [Phycisphaerae bacterium]|nr:hypothetical protein [Phycisphaerae bacterium]